ncbi:MAG: hypothetical protein VR70_17755 [Rhodospirillaceae bacterium BRH_c57]|nr:MAG: hypothetical protein VR70_17755 [Rhodospirillaceae bacterium BRH_c57]
MKLGARRGDDDDHWITVSDLMSGLMVIFLFIAITYIRPLLNERDTVRSIAVTFQQNEVALVDALRDEFQNDLDRWNAELDPETLVVRFKAPEVLFAPARAELRPQFKAILDDFFPRYLAVLDRFRDNIEEVRIEGHTSSDWGDLPYQEAYFRNMSLSQERTRTVLEYGLGLPGAVPYRDWTIGHITANGLSSSRLVRDAQGRELSEGSRRVEFRVRTNAKQEIVRILETVAQ